MFSTYCTTLDRFGLVFIPAAILFDWADVCGRHCHIRGGALVADDCGAIQGQFFYLDNFRR